jgi:hypothetical protein
MTSVATSRWIDQPCPDEQRRRRAFTSPWPAVIGSGADLLPQSSPARGASAHYIPDGQYICSVWVVGNLKQIDGANGDVTLE